MEIVSVSRSAVVADLVPLVLEARRLARVLRLPHGPAPGRAEEQRAKARVARRITELSILLAHFRGKLHVASRPSTFPKDAPFDPHAYARTVAEAVRVPYLVAPRADTTAAVMP